MEEERGVVQQKMPKDSKRRQKTPKDATQVSCPHFSVIRLLKNTVVNGGRKRRRTTKDARKVFLLSSNINIAWYKDTTDTSRLQYYSTHYRLCRQERQYCSTCLTQYVDSIFIIKLKNPLAKQRGLGFICTSPSWLSVTSSSSQCC